MNLHSKRFLVVLVGAVAALTFVSGASAVVKKKNVAGKSVVSKVVKLGTPGVQVLRKGQYVEGEVLVKYKASLRTSANERANMVSRLGGSELRHLGAQRTLQVRLPQGQSVEQALQAYARDPDVEQVQPNYVYRPMRVPNDPEYAQQWGFQNTAQTVSGGEYATHNPGTAGSDMRLPNAWDQVTDCRAVIVAVIDTGVNYTHADLANNMWDGSGAGFPNHGYDTLDNDIDPMPTDASGHGTHVAATIAAEGDNSTAGTGVCWRARIMAVRALSEFGGTTASVVAGVNWAVSQGAHVINMSLGGDIYDQAFSDAIANARTNAVVVVVAAGNDSANNDSGSTPTYPCNFTHDNLICVAALDQAYSLATFSNTGATSVDVGAPGTNVLSAWPGAHLNDRQSNFSAWILGGAWTRLNGCNTYTYTILANPASWCSGGPYANDARDQTYTTYNLGTASAVLFNAYWLANLEQDRDWLDIALYNNGGNPFAINGTVLTSFTGPNLANDIDGIAIVDDVNVSYCNTANCSLGFQLWTDSATTLRGVGILEVTVDTLIPSSSFTHVIDGTSMATPHVAGLAAMLRAFNPNYTYLDTVESIKNGGRAIAALTNVTTTGRAADAWGSLRYIKAPTGVAAVVQ